MCGYVPCLQGETDATPERHMPDAEEVAASSSGIGMLLATFSPGVRPRMVVGAGRAIVEINIGVVVRTPPARAGSFNGPKSPLVHRGISGGFAPHSCQSTFEQRRPEAVARSGMLPVRRTRVRRVARVGRPVRHRRWKKWGQPPLIMSRSGRVDIGREVSPKRQVAVYVCVLLKR